MPRKTQAGRKGKPAAGGLRVDIGIGFAAFIACVLVTDRTGLAALALACAAVHECGHFAALFLAGARVREISFRIFGVDIRLAHSTAVNYRQEILISLAGPAANFLLTGLACALAWAGFYPAALCNTAILSALLGFFNLLPISALDGGRVLEAILCSSLECAKAQKILDIVSAVAVIPVTIGGFLLIMRTGYNFTLLIAAVYLIFCLIFKERLIGRT